MSVRNRFPRIDSSKGVPIHSTCKKVTPRTIEVSSISNNCFFALRERYHFVINSAHRTCNDTELKWSSRRKKRPCSWEQRFHLNHSTNSIRKGCLTHLLWEITWYFICCDWRPMTSLSFDTPLGIRFSSLLALNPIDEMNNNSNQMIYPMAWPSAPPTPLH